MLVNPVIRQAGRVIRPRSVCPGNSGSWDFRWVGSRPERRRAWMGAPSIFQLCRYSKGMILFRCFRSWALRHNIPANCPAGLPRPMKEPMTLSAAGWIAPRCTQESSKEWVRAIALQSRTRSPVLRARIRTRFFWSLKDSPHTKFIQTAFPPACPTMYSSTSCAPSRGSKTHTSCAPAMPSNMTISTRAD